MAHEHSHDHRTSGNIKVAFFLNLGFTLIEIVGGIWTNSLAILSDALHDFGDSLSLGLSWYLQKYSEKGQDRRYSYGYRRFSLLAALINTVVLIAGSLIILSEAVPRLFAPEHPKAGGMLVLAIVGVLMNGVAVLRLRRGESMNVRVVAWHLLEDVLGWAAVLIVSVILLFKDIHVLDPILSVLITLYVLYNVVRNLRKTLTIFLQAVPENIDISAIEEKILNLDKVKSVHHTHAWSLDGEHNVLSTHVVVEPETTRNQARRIRSQIRSLIEDSNFEHVTIELELGSENCDQRRD